MEFVDCEEMGGDMFFMEFSPNPATSETLIELKRNDEKAIDSDINWEFEVYDMSQTLKTKVFKFKEKKHKISVNGWKNGVYFVIATVNNEIVTGKFIVKK